MSEAAVSTKRGWWAAVKHELGRKTEPSIFIRLIILDKVARAVLAILLGTGLLRLLHSVGIVQALEEFVSDLNLGAIGRSLEVQLENLASLPHGTLIRFAIGAYAYAALELVEGIGLFRQRRWAEYLTLLATLLPIPFIEIPELVAKLTIIRASVLIINIAIVIYLIIARRLFRSAPEEHDQSTNESKQPAALSARPITETSSHIHVLPAEQDTSMQLQQLLQGLPEPPGATSGSPYDLPIAGIAYDSRKIAPGWLFVAVRGTHTDGHRYIAEAFRKGALAAVGEEPAPPDLPADAPYIQVRDSRRDLAALADSFYDHPSRKLGVIGITGTKGKSTTTNLIAEVFQRAGQKSGLMSTLNFRIGDHDWENETRQTTQESLENHAMLAEMARQNVRYAVIETSSHGLALHRVSGIVYDVGIATNITSEHLEFHGTVEQYRRDKARLFEGLDPAADKGLGAQKAAILNRDDSSYDYLLPFCRVPVTTYAIDQQADIRAVDLELSGASSRFRVVTPGGEVFIETPLIGRFNVYNCLATISAGYTQGLDLQQMGETLATISGVPGRMERVDCGQPFTVIVDYAHNPDSLEQVLRLLRPLTPGRIIAVFGSAGERDTQKRPEQGAISARLADLTFLTDEDCREEDPEKILHEIAAGALEAGAVLDKNLWLIVDRRQAIGAAFDAARPGDTVLLAGKGHEHSIIVGRESLPWDEREVARDLLRERWTSAGQR